MTKPTVIIFMEGGVVQNVQGNIDVEVIVMDGDTEGGDKENIVTVPDSGDWYVIRWNTDAQADADWVNEYLKNLE